MNNPQIKLYGVLTLAMLERVVLQQTRDRLFRILLSKIIRNFYGTKLSGRTGRMDKKRRHIAFELFRLQL